MDREKRSTNLGAKLLISEIATGGQLGQLFGWFLMTNKQVAQKRNRNGLIPGVSENPEGHLQESICKPQIF